MTDLKVKRKKVSPQKNVGSVVKFFKCPPVKPFHFSGGGIATRRGVRKKYLQKNIIRTHARREVFIMGEEVYKLTKKQVIRRNKIHTAMTDQMKENGTYKEPFIDISERYIAMWEVSMMLEDDIQKRGVQIMTEKGPKKNDSVAMLTNMNKQMLICLEKLGLSVSTVKNELGGDI